MAANFRPGHDELFEILNDSGSEDEFEGFDLEDWDENIVRPQFDGLSIENWREGDREPTALAFTATPGLTAEATLPENPQPIGYFVLFFYQTDLEKMSEETNRYANNFLEKIKVLWKRKPHGRKWWLMTVRVLFDRLKDTYLCIFSCELLWKLPRISGLFFLDHFYAYKSNKCFA